MKLQKLGGYSSMAWVLIGIVSGALAHSVFQGFTGSDYHDPGKMISAYQTFPMAFYTWYALGILKAILILIIVLALEERMQKDAPNLMRIAIMAICAYSALFITTMMGGIFRNALLGSNDLVAYRAILIVSDFIGSSAEFLFGCGLLMIGWAVIRTRRLPQILGYIILIMGIVSIIQFSFVILGSRLGRVMCNVLPLIGIVWLGIYLIRNPEPNIE